MANDLPSNSRFRPLLTETLPYEVPLVFSNEQFFDSVREQVKDAKLATALRKLRSPIRRYSKPYQYNINKDFRKTRNLYIIHPVHQLEICSFYERYGATILYSCSKSQFSLRAPIKISRTHADKVGHDENAALKDGEVEVGEPEPASEPPIIRSYFRYSGYEPLGAFRSSVEFVRLEKRFSLLRRLDVAKCFSNLYTHSLAWAVKDKEIAKRAAGSHSFENEFDRLMQKSNYNETNGIPVGPEVSRIFAEIVFQDVDCTVLARLKACGLQEEWDYAVRRYIDDFHIFANSINTIDQIEKIICEELERYKLYLNDGKTTDETRPFVSSISGALLDVEEVFRQAGRLIATVAQSDVDESKRGCADLRKSLQSIRTIMGRHSAPPSALSGWVLSSTLRSMSRLIARRAEWLEKMLHEELIDLLEEFLELTFYMCAVDSRVRPSYRLGQIMNVVEKNIDAFPEHAQDRLRHVIAENLIALTRREAVADAGLSQGSDNVELFNYLICGALFIGEDYLAHRVVRDALQAINRREGMTYFRYVTAKVCMLAAQHLYEEELEALNLAVTEKVVAAKGSIDVDAEAYLLLCDIVSAPDIDEGDKRALFDTLFGGQVSKQTMAQLVPRVGFVDWRGVNVEHLLKRKELRSLYD